MESTLTIKKGNKMNIKEIELYILSKPNAKKNAIHEWKYIRYTTYSLMFASLSKIKENDTILTVLGRFEQYEKDYNGIIVPAIDNEFRHFSSIYLTKANIPDCIIKAMIDYSYRERIKTVTIPQSTAASNSDFTYMEILPNNKNDSSNCNNQTVSKKEIAAATQTKNMEKNFYGIKKLLQDDETIDFSGNDLRDNLPYNFINDKRLVENYKEIMKIRKTTNINKFYKNSSFFQASLS